MAKIKFQVIQGLFIPHLGHCFLLIVFDPNSFHIQLFQVLLCTLTARTYTHHCTWPGAGKSGATAGLCVSTAGTLCRHLYYSHALEVWGSLGALSLLALTEELMYRPSTVLRSLQNVYFPQPACP